jgi:general secretion pathway protein D
VTPQPPISPAAAAGGASAAFEGAIKLTHDKTSNSLVVISSAKDWIAVKELIRKLDSPRRQVFVEAIIMEVSTDYTRKQGVSYHGGTTFGLQNPDDSIFFLGVEAKALSSLGLPDPFAGLLAGIRGPDLKTPFLGITIPSVGMMFQLLQDNSNVNVLSSPNILAINNGESEINVGQNIPYTAGVSAGFGIPTPAPTAGGTTPTPTPAFGGLPFQNIQRENLTLKLKITPHINESEMVRLKIEQEIKDLLSENFAGLGPSWSTRNLKTEVVVRDQQTVVIGGLMADKVSVDESKVPILGDIPVLGFLFKYTTHRKTKTNLLIVLTPYIIKDQADLQRIYERKIRERKDFIETYSYFHAQEIDPFVDYTRKRGLLAEINRAIILADEDDRIMRELKGSKKQRYEGPVEEQPPATQPAGGQQRP